MGGAICLCSLTSFVESDRYVGASRRFLAALATYYRLKGILRDAGLISE
jgi:hypothetical protein